MEKSGISVLPFYKTVEFTEGMDPKASARLEAQLQKAGILDALVIADEDLKKVRRDFPEFLGHGSLCSGKRDLCFWRADRQGRSGNWSEGKCETDSEPYE